MSRRKERPDPPRKPDARPTRVLEEGVRLSASRLWELQRAYFSAQDPLAWSRGRVPSYITSNAFAARAAARVVEAFANDAGEPIDVLELGAGSGRFAYNVVRELADAGVDAHYVLTDFDERLVAGIARHARLRSFVDAGLLSFATCDIERDTTVQGIGQRPLAVLANYVFDGVRMDAFEAHEGIVHESFPRLALPTDVDPSSPSALSELEVSFERGPPAEGPFGDEEMDAYVRACADLDGHVLYPTSAVRALRRLRSMAKGGRLMVLASDRGQPHRDGLYRLDAPRIVRHGSVSLDVNFHALSQHALATGGRALLPEHHPESLVTAVFVWGRSRETEKAYRYHVARGGPEDLYVLKEALHRGRKRMGYELALAWLRQHAYDAEVFLDCAPALIEAAAEAPPVIAADIASAMEHVRAAYFPLEGDRDVAGALAELGAELASRQGPG